MVKRLLAGLGMTLLSTSVLFLGLDAQMPANAAAPTCQAHNFVVSEYNATTSSFTPELTLQFNQSAQNCSVSKINKTTLGPFQICSDTGSCSLESSNAIKSSAGTYVLQFSDEILRPGKSDFFLKYSDLSQQVIFEHVILPISLGIDYYPLRDSEVNYDDYHYFYKQDQILFDTHQTQDISLAVVSFYELASIDREYQNIEFVVLNSKNKTIATLKDMKRTVETFNSPYRMFQITYSLPASIAKKLTVGAYRLKTTLKSEHSYTASAMAVQPSRIPSSLEGALTTYKNIFDSYFFSVTKYKSPVQKKATTLSVSVSTHIVHVSTRKTISVSVKGGKNLANGTCEIAMGDQFDATDLNSSGSGIFLISDVDYALYFSAGHSRASLSVDCYTKKYEGYKSIPMLITR